MDCGSAYPEFRSQRGNVSHRTVASQDATLPDVSDLIISEFGSVDQVTSYLHSISDPVGHVVSVPAEIQVIDVDTALGSLTAGVQDMQVTRIAMRDCPDCATGVHLSITEIDGRSNSSLGDVDAGRSPSLSSFQEDVVDVVSRSPHTRSLGDF